MMSDALVDIMPLSFHPDQTKLSGDFIVTLSSLSCEIYQKYEICMWKQVMGTFI